MKKADHTHYGPVENPQILLALDCLERNIIDLQKFIFKHPDALDSCQDAVNTRRQVWYVRQLCEGKMQR